MGLCIGPLVRPLDHRNVLDDGTLPCHLVLLQTLEPDIILQGRERGRRGEDREGRKAGERGRERERERERGGGGGEEEIVVHCTCTSTCPVTPAQLMRPGIG